MSPAEVLEIAADLAEGQFTVVKAVSATTGYLAAVDGGQHALDLLDLSERHGEAGSLPEILRLHCTRAADVAASLHRAARQARYEAAA